ncbi:MAG: radical SAM protein [Fimbriimonadaceae bacterium]
MPISASYYTTTICNAKCGFCDIWEGKPSSKPRLVPLDKAERIISGLKKLGVKYIDFTGGEPLLCRNLPELLRIAKSKGIRTGVCSNGFLYPGRADELKGLVDSQAFSLDSADRDRHNASRQIVAYDRIIESIEIAKRNKTFVNINFSVGNENLHEVEPMCKLAKDLQVVVHVMPMFSYFGNAALQKELTAHLKSLFLKPYMSVNLASVKLQKAGGNDIAKPKCKAIRANIAVSPDGKFYLPCYHAAVDKPEIEDDIVAQWKSPYMQEQIAKAGRYDFCQGCSIWCYLTPSFLYTLDSYFLLQAFSYGVSSGKAVLGKTREMIGLGRKITYEEYRREGRPTTELDELLEEPVVRLGSVDEFKRDRDLVSK